VFEAGMAFGAMLILVRVIAPEEYGRASVVLGFLALLNCFNFGVFASQALLLSDRREPDWSLHWSAGLYIQTGLMAACHGLAGLCWAVPGYRLIAPLLHVAAFGLWLDWPAQLLTVMLRRELNFRRLKLLLALSNALKLAVTIAVGVVGGGAYAIVLGNNVVTPLPLAIDLLLLRGWRPHAGWWRWPDWGRYTASLSFGLQQAGSGLLGSARSALEAAILPQAVGYGSIGLLNRARALFGITAGRLASVLVETGYPFLPRAAADRTRYARQAGMFLQVVFLALLPGAVYIGIEGPSLSRLLYGGKWVAADPLILPAVLAALGAAAFGAASSVLLATARLRLCLVLDALAAAFALPVVAVAWWGGGIVAFAWAAAAGQLVATVVALAAASAVLGRGWSRSVLLPAATSSVFGAGVLLAVVSLAEAWPSALRIVVGSSAYGLTVLLTLRGCFPSELATVLLRVPGGGWVMERLRFPAGTEASAPAPKRR
jgi:O-antigen/teichoic acid export membrane protein